MKSTAQVRNHPIHPMLVVIPSAAVILALIMDIVFLATGDPMWWRATFPILVIGVGGAILAAIPGLIDLVSVAPKQNATGVGAAHMMANFILIAVMALNVGARAGTDPTQMAAGGVPLAFWLSLIAFILLGIGGWLGTKMVYVYKVGVLEQPEAKSPRHAGEPEIESPA